LGRPEKLEGVEQPCQEGHPDDQGASQSIRRERERGQRGDRRKQYRADVQVKVGAVARRE